MLLSPPTTQPLNPITTPTTSSSTPTQAHNVNTTHNQSTDTDSNDTETINTATYSSPSSATASIHSYWPFFTLAGFLLVLLVTLLPVLSAIGYCWLRSSKLHKKIPLKRTSSVRADTPKDSNRPHSNFDLNSRDRQQNSFYSQTNNTGSLKEFYTANNGSRTTAESQHNHPEGQPWYHSADLPNSGTELGSPTLSKRSTSRQSKRSHSSDSPETLNFRQSQNSLLPPAIPGGVYSTRTPPSHPHRLSHHSGTPHTQRGSTSSFQGGRNSRASNMPSRSRSSNSWSSNRTETKSP